MNDALRALYQEVILDHGRRPRNFHALDGATHQAHGDNPLCGDTLDLYLRLSAEGVIEEAAFQGHGCAISTASASLMTEVLRGLTVAQAEALFDAFQALALGQPKPAPAGLEGALARLEVLGGVRDYPVRIKCAILAWHALKAALHGEAKASSEAEG